ncbi:MAG: hypothetical protein KF873_06695 [Gemmataceae bacterium]|nr:hypothetical protein [Gemmataceae bacterium]
MADAAPRLSPSGDPVGYAPYSVTAILAAVLAGLFLAALVLLGGAALIGGTQLVEPLFLILPAAILVLAFAARRQIANSEGTRVGVSLCNFAWWVAVLGGSGYGAYLVGRMVGVQQDTKEALVEWMAVLQKADPIDPRTLDFHKAFQKTIDIGRQKSLEAKTPAEIEAAQRGFADDTGSTIGITRFRQLDLLRILHRNRNFAPQFTFDGLQSWQQDQSGLRCKSAGTLRCPEGEFRLNFDMMRQPVPGDRPAWRVVAPANGFVGSGKLTRYGRELEKMERYGRVLVTTSLLTTFGALPQFRPQLVADFEKPNEFAVAIRYFSARTAECAAVGVAATVRPEPPGYETLIKSQFFAPIARSDAAKDGDPRERFFAAWRDGRIVPAGLILAETPDQYPLITVTEKMVEMRVPIEIQSPRLESSQSAARGAVVLVCDDAEYIGKLNELRRAAATEAPAESWPTEVFEQSIPWKIVRIVSDMKHVTMPKPQQPQDNSMGGGF